jgi:hypothetical protein
MTIDAAPTRHCNSATHEKDAAISRRQPGCTSRLPERRAGADRQKVIEIISELRRQDSNLNYLNQNQRCCRLHHDGLLRPAAKPRPL